VLADVEHKNPRLHGMRAQVRAAKERPAQARALEDPMLMVELWQVPWERSHVPLMFTLRQPLPWPGKLHARAAALAPETTLARADSETATRDLRLQACRAYYGYRLAIRSAQVLREVQGVLASTVAVLEARYRVGRAELAELLKGQEAVVNIDNLLLDVDRERDLAAAALSTLRGDDPRTPLGEPISVPMVRALPEVTTLVTRALAQRSELVAAQASITQAQARAQAARMERAPDLAVWASVMADIKGSQDSFSVGVQTSIPSFSLAKHSAAGREAQAQAQVAQAGRQAMELQIRSEVQQAALRLESTLRHLALHRSSLIPLSEHAARAAQSGFQSGKVPLMLVLEAARALSEHRLEYERFLAEYGQRWAELEAAVGAPLLDTGPTPPAGAPHHGEQP
jgi:outer membrane protein TolC